MKSKVCTVLLLGLFLSLKQVKAENDGGEGPENTPGLNFNPQVIPDPNMASYNAFWDGAVGFRGYWGSLPQPNASVFSPSFDVKGIGFALCT
ncbi:MAG: hypothetical protein AAFO58_13140 [Pseudomonadota bacterium]